MPRYVRITPFVRMPRSLGFFDYALPDGMEAEPGEIVLAPFRGRKMPGLVVAVSDRTEVPKNRIKEIHDVLDAPPLSEATVSTILEIAETSLTSPATTTHALLPTVPKRKVPHEGTSPEWAPEEPPEIPPLWHDALETPGIALLAHDLPEDRERLIRAALAHAHASGRPLLFIAPRIDVAKAFVTPFGDAAALITGEGAMTARWKAWMSAADRPIVAGTALALFAPIPKPSVILVDEEDATEHLRTDASPRFDVRRAAETMANAWNIPLVFLSRAPSVALWSRLGQGVRLLPKTAPKRVRTVICDFGDEFRSKRFRPVTEPFLLALDRAYADGKRAAVVVNRKGDAARLACRDCRSIARCGNCSATLAVHGATLVCPRCRAEEAVPDLCPSCHGARLAGSGAGIETVASFLAERYPDAKIRTFTKETHPEDALTADIVLGTEYLMTHAHMGLLNDDRLGFVGTLSADTFLVRLTDPLTPEHEYRRLRRLGLLAAAHDLPLHLQTSEPELPLYAMLATDPKTWYRLELEDRKTAGIHPFEGFSRLVATGTDHDKLKGEAERLASELKPLTTHIIHEVRIVRSGRMSKAWIGLTFPFGSEADVRAALKGRIPEQWGYDPAPHHPIH